jgi:leishmanolysin
MAASADETVMALRKTRHHHCVHEEKSQRFDDSVDRDSLMTPQLVLPLESPSQHELNAFLEAVGAKRRLRSSSSERSLAASASSTAFQPIRIAFDVSKLTSDTGSACTREGEVVQVDESAYTCTSGDVLTADKREFIITVLLKAIKDYFESTLSVQRVVGNLVIKGIGCSTTDDWACCANSIPPSYKTEGVADADFVLHVTGRPTTGSTIAWALPCNLDQFGRPVSGQANFGPGLIDPVTVAARTEQIGTALHEMTHALVFSRGRFSDFRQPLNGPKWGYNNVVSQSQGPGGIWVSKIVTPSVAKQAKVQFNCFDWVNAGIELENGDSGSADFSSHWEKRILMNEYMTATSSYDPVYSAMTLALFEDSGWYQVSFKNAQVLPWGYMEGCGVAQGRCSTWNSRYICSEAAQTGCTADYTSKGYCNVASYTSSIPAGFQYFDDQKFGGRDTYADYCPFYRAYSNGDCRNIGRTPTNVNSDNYMEQVGPNSKCFQSSLSKSGSDTAALRSSCYKVLGCTSKGLRLSIGSGEVLCPMEGGAMRVSGYKGTIMCPVANRLCQMMQDKCSGNGVLSSSGDCECNPGFVGDDCSGIACPVSAATNAECGSAAQGKCDYTTGKCACTSAYTGITCSELVCPSSSGGKNTSECSGHGACDRVNGVCKCGDGYSGKACECVPGCTATSCGANGACDCLTGACSCVAGYSGVSCLVPSNAPTVELTEQGDTVNTTVGTKEYKFYKINLRSSTYDVTFSVQYANNGSKGVDVDLYGSFVDKYPTSLTAKTVLFVSDNAIGNRDEIHLCGSLGVFPRGLNNTFRYCPRPTSAYVTETPGVFYLSVLGYTGGAYSLSVVADKCRNVTCSYHGACGVVSASPLFLLLAQDHSD